MAITEMTNQEILSEMGRRLREYRLGQDLTAESLATRAGLSVTTILNAERGKNPTLETVVKILRNLGRLENLNAFLPEPTISPMELLRRGTPKMRQRASGSYGADEDNG
jgi:transcriptional regulator with XRE-family HTH domain